MACWRRVRRVRRPALALNPNGPAAGAGTLAIGGDLPVNRMGFGAMRITGEGIWGEPADPKEAFAVLRRALQLGTNFIDTADAYGPYVSEELIRMALYPYPRGLLIATKGGQVRPNRDSWVPDGRPEHLRAACEASLARLKLERIDLYQLHRPDPNVPFEDSVGELAKLQKEGKIRHIGLSNVDPNQLAKAQGIVKIASVQNRYNVADRGADDVLALCEKEQIAFIPWGPLAQQAQASAAPSKQLVALQAVAKARNIDIEGGGVGVAAGALAGDAAHTGDLEGGAPGGQCGGGEDQTDAAGDGAGRIALIPVRRSSASTSLPPSRNKCASVVRHGRRQGGRLESADSSPCPSPGSSAGSRSRRPPCGTP